MSRSIPKVLAQNFRRAVRRDRLDEAAQILDRLKAEAPLALETRGVELEYLIETRQYDEAEPLADQLCRMHPESSRIWFLAGKCAYRCKLYPKAEHAFRESHRLFPHSRSEHWLGKTLTQMGKFDEARSILEAIRTEIPFAVRDLIWLFERMEDYPKAVACCEELLKMNPDDSAAREQLARLKARIMAPEELVDELDALQDLGEDIPTNLMGDYLAKLFSMGRTEEARALVSEHMNHPDKRLRMDLGWKCHHAKVHDLACDLWLPLLPEQMNYVKFVNALQYDMRMCRRLERLLEIYAELAPRHKPFYGRIRKLEKMLDH
ncbi:MAG: tetratricopeptide repeat protein [Acidobacteriota bacterium]|nr:tetratricopeptide repeat protein [Acidobacteriota bacterium]